METTGLTRVDEMYAEAERQFGDWEVVKDLVDDANCRIKRRLDGIPAVDGCVTTQDLLQGVGDEALAVIHQLFEQ